MLRTTPVAALAVTVLSGLIACPVWAEEAPGVDRHLSAPPAGNPTTAQASASKKADQDANPATVDPTTRDREIAELRKIIEDLRTKLTESESLKQVTEQLLKRIEALEQAKPEAPPAATAPGTSPGGSATLLPNISVIGNLVLGGGDTRRVPNRGRFNFEELEIAFQDAVSPKMRYDVFFSAAKDEEWGVGMEEGFLTATALYPGLNLRVGRIRTPVGKFNPLHPHQWAFITQPSVQGALMGPEGLSSDGAVAEYTFPTKGFFARGELGIWQTASESEDGLGYASNGLGAYSGRIWLGKEMGRDRELELGFSRYQGNSDVMGLGRRHVALNGLDLTYRHYLGQGRRIKASAELIDHETSVLGPNHHRLGGFAYVTYRMGPYWEAGVRGDYTKFPFPVDGQDWGGSLFLTKYLTEQTSLRLEYQYTNSPLLGTGNGLFFQILFGSGPHTHNLQ